MAGAECFTRFETTNDHIGFGVVGVGGVVRKVCSIDRNTSVLGIDVVSLAKHDGAVTLDARAVVGVDAGQAFLLELLAEFLPGDLFEVLVRIAEPDAQ